MTQEHQQDVLGIGSPVVGHQRGGLARDDPRIELVCLGELFQDLQGHARLMVVDQLLDLLHLRGQGLTAELEFLATATRANSVGIHGHPSVLHRHLAC